VVAQEYKRCDIKSHLELFGFAVFAELAHVHPLVADLTDSVLAILEGLLDVAADANVLVDLVCLLLGDADAWQVIPVVTSVAANHLTEEGLTAQAVRFDSIVDLVNEEGKIHVNGIRLGQQRLKVLIQSRTLVQARVL